MTRNGDRWVGARLGALLVICWVAAGCTGDAEPATAPRNASSSVLLGEESLASQVRRLTAGRKIGPLRRPAPVRPALVALGQALLFDPILSGNRDISCMTCHQPRLATGDARHLAIGQGGAGFGRERSHPYGAFIPRNAPPLFNLHALDKLFWDGRVSVDREGGFHTPVGDRLTKEMTRVFEFGAISALGLFPVLSREEMRAVDGNELASLPDDSVAAIWGSLMRRLGAIPEYRRLFEGAYPGAPFASMTFAHASNAMAGFVVEKLAFNNSPWDRFLAGDDAAMSEVQLRGAFNFMSAKCSICHNGTTFSDGEFHNVALAQLGPGQGDGDARNDDFGRERVTGRSSDRYRFRSTPLRNVELTAPYGHAGQFVKLRDFVDHYSESKLKLFSYDANQLEPLLRGQVLRTFENIMATRDTLLDGVFFPPVKIDEVASFMLALTDPAARNLTPLVPARVPSGLPVFGK
jgi:cytochrome c peroxidase